MVQFKYIYCNTGIYLSRNTRLNHSMKPNGYSSKQTTSNIHLCISDMRLSDLSKKRRVVWSVRRSVTKLRQRSRVVTSWNCRRTARLSSRQVRPRQRHSLALRPQGSRERQLWNRPNSRYWQIRNSNCYSNHFCARRLLISEI